MDDDDDDLNVDCLSGRLEVSHPDEDSVIESCLDAIHQITDKVFLSGVRPLASTDLLEQLDIGLVLCCAAPESKIASTHARLLEQLPNTKLVVIPYDDASTQVLATSCEQVPPILVNFDLDETVDYLLSSDLLNLSHQVMDDFEGKVLVHCYAGISRSVSIVCYHLMKTQKMTFEQALDHVQSKRPIADPNDGFRRQLKAWEGILRLMDDLEKTK